TFASNAGIVYKFTTIGAGYTHTIGNPNVYGSGADDNFGYAIAVNDSLVAISAVNEDIISYTNSGVVYVYDIITSNLIYTIQNPNAYGTSANDGFGEVIKMNDTHLFVSTSLEDSIENTSTGVVYIFDLDSGLLVETLLNENKYTSPNNDQFGYTMSIDDFLVIGAYEEKDITDTYDESGVVYIYDIETFTLLDSFDNPNLYGLPENDRFGFSLFTKENYLIVGAYREE